MSKENKSIGYALAVSLALVVLAAGVPMQFLH